MHRSVVRKINGGICTIILNRPEKLNALNNELFQQLSEYVDDLYQSYDTFGCVILRGSGGCFSAGHDITELGKEENGLKNAYFETKTITRLARVPQPVIVAVEKHCYTGALELALAGDIIIAAKSARFGDTHGKFGLTPLWGMSQRLPRRIGYAKAKEMVFTGKIYSGDEALDIGLVNMCIKDKMLDTVVETVSRSIIQNSWFTNRAYKKLLDYTEAMSLNDGLRYEFENTEGYSPNSKKRINSFLKR
jgi:enoyl-CoA hydratase/carnithine racemase